MSEQTAKSNNTLQAEASEPPKISVQEAWSLFQSGADPVFLDTRNLKHWGASDVKIPGSLRIWREDLAARIDEVPRGRPVIAYCTCHREHSSGKATQILMSHGFHEAFALMGGMDAWRDAGLPLVPKDQPVLK
jgi:rhodanese-related sulfurtransferase